MGQYQVEVHGVKVKVSVVAVEAGGLIDNKIYVLRSLLQRRVMGLDLKKTQHNVPAILLLCVEGHCFIIPKFNRLFDSYQRDASKSGLGQLLSDRTICFVTCNLCAKIMYPCTYYAELSNMIEGRGVELGHLAGRILKKPKLENEMCGLAELASEVGIDIKPLSSGACPDDWVNKVIFSEEEIKDVVHNVRLWFLFGWEQAVGHALVLR